MKLQLLAEVLLFLPTCLLSQNDARLTMPSVATQERSLASSQMVTLEGKVAAEDAATPTNSTAVILECGNTEQVRTNIDREGGFAMSIHLVAADSAPGLAQLPPGTISTLSWSECELYADAPGFDSQHLRMSGKQQLGVIDVGTLLLHPFSRPNDGGMNTVSATSLAAPDKAKKAFAKGQEQERKGKWAAACDSFKKAVEVYPRYAIAWLELGRTQLKENDLGSAQQSFHHATEDDPSFLEAYEQSASLAAKQREWKELADSTEHIVELSPASTPTYWFLNSAANYNLGNVARAESSVTRGLRLDPRHELPQLEYLYGMILARRGDYKGAVQHVQMYLQLSPHATDAAEAQSRLAELQRLAASEPLSR
jgi:tetratricopeptide (TPR) repeat protein